MVSNEVEYSSRVLLALGSRRSLSVASRKICDVDYFVDPADFPEMPEPLFAAFFRQLCFHGEFLPRGRRQFSLGIRRQSATVFAAL